MLHAFNVTQACLRDQLEKVLCFSQGHNTYDLQLVFGMPLDFLNTVASIRPVIDAYSFKLRMMYPGPRGFSRASRKPRSSEDELRSGEKRKTSGYLGLESHFHADARVRI